MNQQRQPRKLGGGGGAGSVRIARERAEAAALPLDTSAPGRPNLYNNQPRSNPAANRPRPQMPTGVSGVRDEQGQIGVAISRPTQVPQAQQWPLAARRGGSTQNQYQPPAGRGIAPQRPPRPRDIPSMLDASRLQGPTPSFQYTATTRTMPDQSSGGYYDDDGFLSPDIISPTMGSSRPSTVSSVGSIPDFPVPAIPQNAGSRRSGNIGPPPLSRRAGSMNFSQQQSFVSPIPEESPRTTREHSHLSYASSAAIPQEWPDSPGSNYDDFDYYDEIERGYGGQSPDEGRVSRTSTTGDDSEDRGLIRNASLGKRAKPAMVTTKIADKFDGVPKPLQFPRSKSEKENSSNLQKGAAAPAAIGVAMSGSPVNGGGQRETMWPSVGADPTTILNVRPLMKQSSGDHLNAAWPMVGTPGSPLAGGTGLIDPTPSTSAESVPTLANPTGVRLKRSSTADPNLNPILGAYNAASTLTPGPAQRTSGVAGFSRWSGMRRPPRLDIDAVRDAEARGSLTSLPELIRRATKLAAMMDRGKRPGSRNDLNDFPDVIDLSSRGKDPSPKNRGSNLSGMLNAFPPPGSTPRDGTLRPISAWPAGFDSSDKEGDGQKRKPRKAGRRCCGIPCWAFILLLIVILLIVAAAVVVPLYFLVIKKNTEAAAAPTPIQQCQQDTATSCQNGGMASISTGSCSCICINGFTGSTCTIFDGGACSTVTLNDPSVQVANVTFGDAIPRLISAAQSNFSVPLSETVLLARFNTADLSCVSQNALVTFDGQSTRIAAANAIVSPLKNRLRRQESSTSSTPTTTTTSGTATSTPVPVDLTAVFNITQEALDFSRVVVLYILQEETFTNAAAAQSNLQRFFGVRSFTNAAARNVSMGAGNSVDLLNYRIDLADGGPMVGGKVTTTTR